MNYTVQQQDDWKVYFLSHAIVPSEALDRLVLEVFAEVQRGNTKIRFDLSQVPFVSSGGVRMLLQCSRMIKDEDGELHLDHPQPQVRNIVLTLNLELLLQETRQRGAHTAA